MFFGTFTPKLDDKGRLFLPSKFRDGLAAGMVMTRQPDRCLAVWPTDVFLAQVAQTADGPSVTPKNRAFMRMIASGASDESVDNQGRVTIPLPLRQYAGLVKDVAVIGSFDHIEVWDAKAWEAYKAAQEESFAHLGEEESGD